MKSFGTFLKYVRKQRELTQEQVAERLNIVTPVLSKWENDKAVPPLDLLCKLCNVLNVSIEECINSELSDGERLLPPEQYDPEKLGETIKQLRIKNGWSQAEVGKKLFVTSQTVSKWESGGISSLEILGKLAELFGLTPTELLNGLERMPALPKKQTTAEQLKKPNRFILKITAIVLAVIIFLGAIAGLIVGLILKADKDDGTQNDGDKTQTEQPDDTPPDDKKEQPEVLDFVSPIKEFYSVSSSGQINGMYRKGGMLFEVVADTPVYAIADGTIITVGTSIKIEHPGGFVSEYSYFDGNYEVGEKVQKGQQLSTTSSSIFSLNLYLNGERVDPFEYIIELPEPIECPPHVHEWSDWQTNIYRHWKSCECGESEQGGKHEFDGGICTVCGYEAYVPPEPVEGEEVIFGLPMKAEILRFYGESVIDSNGDMNRHKGVDFFAQAGDKVYAVADGVIEIITKNTVGYCLIRIAHSNGVKSNYCGVLPIENLSIGNKVKKGDLIAVVSEVPYNTEEDDGPHLHFTMLVDNVNVNPLDYIPYKEKQT